MSPRELANRPAERLTPLVLICLTAFLFLFPLCVGKPGMPLTYKADEPAYFLMALSLIQDGDLECNLEDRRRAVDEFPHLPAENTIVMTDDGWRTTYFGKPYLFSMAAAPLTNWFGADGMMAFNVLLLMAMVGMGTSYLRRYNSEGLAALFATGFFIVSGLFVYVFWLHPEVFMATGVCACLYFGLVEPEPRPRLEGWWHRLGSFSRRPAVRLAVSASALAAATYHKPMLAVMGVPVLWALGRERRWKAIATWLLAAVIAMGAFGGIAVAFTGHPSAYLGVQRTGIRIANPDAVPLAPQSEAELERLKTNKSWSWLWRLPEFKLHKTLGSLGSFLWGRHTGFIPYMPFAVLAIILFLVNGARDGTRWTVIASAAALALFFLVWIPFNWHGGAGFVGNRYFVTAYPAFLFLVTRVRPSWSLVPAFAFGGALLGVLVFHPLGSPVREPTLQSHVRGRAFKLFPTEKTIHNSIPGYSGVVIDHVWFRGRKDVMVVRGEEMLFYGNLAAQVWMVHPQPIEEPVLFEVRSQAADNEVTLSVGDDTVVVPFTAEDPDDDVQIVELQPSDPELFRPVRIVPDDEPPSYLYQLTVHPRTGKVHRENGRVKDRYFLGAGVRYLGPRRKVYADEAFQVEWLACEAPSTVATGEEFRVETRLRNAGNLRWNRFGLTRVALSYHWYRDGEVAVFEGSRTALPATLEPGEEGGALMLVEAPRVPGTYVLKVDVVREAVAWFSSRNGENFCEATVEIASPS